MSIRYSQVTPRSVYLSRRAFLTTTAGAGLAGILAAKVPPARAQQR